MNTKQALQLHLNKLKEIPQPYQENINLVIEFLEKETDMDWEDFLSLVYVLAIEHCDLYPLDWDE